MKAQTNILSNLTHKHCTKAWPTDARAQCGGKEIDGIGEVTFIEVSLPSLGSHVRGEGDNFEQAETNAWNTFIRYSSCTHEMERPFPDSSMAQCKQCTMKVSDYYPPEGVCEECGQSGCEMLFIDGKKLCFEHYKQKAEIKAREGNSVDSLSYRKTLDKIFVLDLVGAFDNVKNEWEYGRILYRTLNGLSEYSIEVARHYWEKGNFTHSSLHYIDVLEKMEADSEMYRALVKCYLFIEKKFSHQKEELKEIDKKISEFFINVVK